MVQCDNSNPLTRNPELQGSLARSMAASIASLQWRSCICASASAPPQQTDNPPTRLTVSSVPYPDLHCQRGWEAKTGRALTCERTIRRSSDRLSRRVATANSNDPLEARIVEIIPRGARGSVLITFVSSVHNPRLLGMLLWQAYLCPPPRHNAPGQRAH